MSTKGTTQKRSIGTFSNKEKQDSRSKAMKTAISSKAEAGKFLKNAGILTSRGAVSERYRSK